MTRCTAEHDELSSKLAADESERGSSQLQEYHALRLKLRQVIGLFAKRPRAAVPSP